LRGRWIFCTLHDLDPLSLHGHHLVDIAGRFRTSIADSPRCGAASSRSPSPLWNFFSVSSIRRRSGHQPPRNPAGTPRRTQLVAGSGRCGGPIRRLTSSSRICPYDSQPGGPVNCSTCACSIFPHLRHPRRTWTSNFRLPTIQTSAWTCLAFLDRFSSLRLYSRKKVFQPELSEFRARAAASLVQVQLCAGQRPRTVVDHVVKGSDGAWMGCENFAMKSRKCRPHL